jgi:hypothetical protein
MIAPEVNIGAHPMLDYAEQKEDCSQNVYTAFMG